MVYRKRVSDTRQASAGRRSGCSGARQCGLRKGSTALSPVSGYFLAPHETIFRPDEAVLKQMDRTNTGPE
jgi:hypothetical protein